MLHVSGGTERSKLENKLTNCGRYADMHVRDLDEPLVLILKHVRERLTKREAYLYSFCNTDPRAGMAYLPKLEVTSRRVVKRRLRSECLSRKLNALAPPRAAGGRAPKQDLR